MGVEQEADLTLNQIFKNISDSIIYYFLEEMRTYSQTATMTKFAIILQMRM